MNKKTWVAVFLTFAAIGTVAYSTGVLAYRGNPGEAGPNYSLERHEQIQKAFESRDYGAWKELMGDRGAARFITEDNFARFSEMRQLRLDGKTDEANKIREELGLGAGNGQGRAQGMRSGERGQNRGGNFVDQDGDGKCDRM